MFESPDEGDGTAGVIESFLKGVNPGALLLGNGGSILPQLPGSESYEFNVL